MTLLDQDTQPSRRQFLTLVGAGSPPRRRASAPGRRSRRAARR